MVRTPQILATFTLLLVSLGSPAWAEPGTGTARAETPAAMTPDSTCIHCHENRHAADGDGLEACGECHTVESFLPSTFTIERHADLALALQGKHAEVACRTCHLDTKLRGLPNDCAGCHIDRHRGLLGSRCEECHSVQGFQPVENFEHTRTGFSLTGSHVPVDCASCHEGASGLAMRQGQGAACETCHTTTHASFKAACETCHEVDKGASFTKINRSKAFDHRTTGFPLERKHGAQSCAACHPSGAGTPDTRCESCHVSPHVGQLGGQCQDCHKPDRWSLARYDHDLTGWPLRGRHFVAPCSSCHTNQRWIGLTTECYDCHTSDAARAPASIPQHGFGRADCSACHGLWNWRP